MGQEFVEGAAFVADADADEVGGEFFESSSDEFCVFSGHASDAEAGVSEEGESRAVADVEFFEFVAGFGVVHAAVGEDAVDVGDDEADVLALLFEGGLVHEKSSSLRRELAGRSRRAFLPRRRVRSSQGRPEPGLRMQR